MTQAIFEISGMLLGAVGIGIFFTYRYWKSKYEKFTQISVQLKVDLNKLNVQVEGLEKNIETLKSNHQNEINLLKEQFEKDKNALTKEHSQKVKKVQADVDKFKNQVEKEQKQAKEFEKSQKELVQSIELKDEQLGEKERELVEVCKHLKTHNISYYKQIEGKRYKAVTLTEADESVAGSGDGRISMADAEKVFATISDGHIYTQVEKDTMHYIREHYNWTPEADGLFRKKVRSWAAKGHQLDDPKIL